MFERKNSKAAKMTLEQVREMRQYYTEGATQRELALHYGIGIVQVGRIVRGECWTDSLNPVRLAPAAIEASKRRLEALLAADPIEPPPKANGALCPPVDPLDDTREIAPMTEEEREEKMRLVEKLRAFGADRQADVLMEELKGEGK